jgi:predicted glycosyltransferase
MRLRVLFYAVNGLGLGHLTRLMGIARALRRQVPGCEILFLTSSEAAHLAYREGFAAVKLPSRNAARRGELRQSTFARLGQSLVWNTLSAFDPHVLVVDTFALGSWHELAPILRWPMRKVFVFRAQKSERALEPVFLEALKLYDLILLPHHAQGDEVSPRDLRLPAETRAVWCGPMTLRSRHELLPRDEARARILRGSGHPASDSELLGLVALGGGGGPGLDEARALLARSIRLLQQNPQARASQIRWIELSGPLDAASIDAPESQVLEDVPWAILRDVHPMGSVLRAFDGAVAAAGYNTVAEAQVAALPTLLWPFARDVDDQFARANLLAAQHRVLAFEPPPSTWGEADAARLSQQLEMLFEEDLASRLRASMRAAQASHGDVNGTEAAARAITELFSLR